MHDHKRLASLSGVFIAESSCGVFENVKQIVEIVSEDELKFLLAHISFEIHQFIDEMFPDDESHKKCFEYFQKKQREGIEQADMS